MIRKIRQLGKILSISLFHYGSSRHGQCAVVLTYNTLFAIVPLLALLFGISKGFALDQSLEEIFFVHFSAQRQQVEYAVKIAKRALEQSSGGVVAGVGIVFLFWTVMWLVLNVEHSFNSIWGVPSRRNLWRKFSDYLALLLIAPLMLITVGAAGIMIRKDLFSWAEKYSSGFPSFFAESAVMLLTFLLLCSVFFFIYRFTPNTVVHTKNALLGALVAGIAFQLLQRGFITLQGSVFRYNRIYGSFALLPLFLIWLNWSWHIILFGGEITYVSQNLKSGRFDDRTIRAINARQRLEHQLTILTMIFRYFEEYQGAFWEDDLLSRLHVPEVLLREEIDELIAKGMICRIMQQKKPALLPVVPPEKFTLVDFLKRICGEGESRASEFSASKTAFSEMEKALADGYGKKLVRDVVADELPQEEKSC